MLYVPEESIEQYSNADQWREFFNIIPWEGALVDGLLNGETSEIVNCYDLTGRKASASQSGICIVVCSDGTRRKMLVRK